MKIDSAFYHDLTLATIHFLGEYYSTMESELELLKSQERERIRAEITNQQLAPEEIEAEWDIGLQEYEAKYEMHYTNFYHYSFVVLVYLIVEDKLRELCQVVQDVKNFAEQPPQASRDIIKTYRNYLKKAGVSIDDQLWQPIYDIKEVRHCIVHASGNVKLSKTKNAKRVKHLEELARRNIGLVISGSHYMGKLTPLYLEDNRLLLESEYCKLIVNDVRKFFQELCKTVPLPRVEFG